MYTTYMSKTTPAKTKTFKTLSAARAHALAISTEFPREYVAIVNVFGWMVTRRTRLGTFAPSDYTDWSGQAGTYWIGGTEGGWLRRDFRIRFTRRR